MMKNLSQLANVRIVLINTSHPGNIGAAARAMKTMGLTQLYLVQPKMFPHAKAHEMASNADDILNNSVVVDNLEDALTGCELVVGASARQRALPWPLLTPREMGQRLVQAAEQSQVALLFGCEQSGLTNAQLQRCQYHVNIPANPDYSSLNLAQAVQVLCYEIRLGALGENISSTDQNEPLASDHDLKCFFTHLEETLKDLNVLKASCPRQLMPRMRRLFTRVELEKSEVDILRGILNAAQKKAKK